MASRKSEPTLVLFVRHGTTPTTGKVLPGRAKGLHLSNQGLEQAEVVAGRIFESMPGIDAIYTSPLERCNETAKPLASLTGLKPVSEKGFLECDFGSWTGAQLKDLQKKPEWKTIQQTPSLFRFPNGESFLEMQSRIVTTISSICQKHIGGRVVVFSHADPIKTALVSAMSAPLDTIQRLSVSPCSISAVLYGSPQPTVLTINSTDLKPTFQPS